MPYANAREGRLKSRGCQDSNGSCSPCVSTGGHVDKHLIPTTFHIHCRLHLPHIMEGGRAGITGSPLCGGKAESLRGDKSFAIAQGVTEAAPKLGHPRACLHPVSAAYPQKAHGKKMQSIFNFGGPNVGFTRDPLLAGLLSSFSPLYISNTPANLISASPVGYRSR